MVYIKEQTGKDVAVIIIDSEGSETDIQRKMDLTKFQLFFFSGITNTKKETQLKNTLKSYDEVLSIMDIPSNYVYCL